MKILSEKEEERKIEFRKEETMVRMTYKRNEMIMRM